MWPTLVHWVGQELAHELSELKLPQTWVDMAVVVACVQPALQLEPVAQPVLSVSIPSDRSTKSLQFQSQPSGEGSMGWTAYCATLKPALGFTSTLPSWQSRLLGTEPVGHTPSQNIPVGATHLFPNMSLSMSG